MTTPRVDAPVRRRAAWLFLPLLLALGGCKVNLGDDQTYSCTTLVDCGGGGFVCVFDTGTDIGRCCHKTGADTCLPAGVDAGCTSDVTKDHDNCGQCFHRCQPIENCVAGLCIPSTETSCSDGVDNDHNGKTDCADTACEGRDCGNGCTCVSEMKREVNCGDGVDNDGDGQTDCADSDCGSELCGNGCACDNGGKVEIDCADGHDNDSDGLTDCADPDCAGLGCHTAPATYTCTAALVCACNGGSASPEDGGDSCRDGIDNDCNGATDCADQGCDLVSCNPDGGPGCVCAGHKPTELACGDLLDNDGDGLIDCADFLDCPEPVNCTVVTDAGTRGGTCGTDHACH